MEMEHQPEDFDMGTVEQSQDASLQTDDVQGVEHHKILSNKPILLKGL